MGGPRGGRTHNPRIKSSSAGGPCQSALYISAGQRAGEDAVKPNGTPCTAATGHRRGTQARTRLQVLRPPTQTLKRIVSRMAPACVDGRTQRADLCVLLADVDGR
jgi:hypothetical protein